MEITNFRNELKKLSAAFEERKKLERLEEEKKILEEFNNEFQFLLQKIKKHAEFEGEYSYVLNTARDGTMLEYLKDKKFVKLLKQYLQDLSLSFLIEDRVTFISLYVKILWD